MFRVIVIFQSDDMAKIVLKSCETCNASTLLHTPAGDVADLHLQKILDVKFFVNAIVEFEE